MKVTKRDAQVILVSFLPVSLPKFLVFLNFPRIEKSDENGCLKVILVSFHPVSSPKFLVFLNFPRINTFYVILSLSFL